ncbi:AlpA family phage regulatory protein [Serratia sp. 14-2641]|uniref:helix-turn-helix transcriptional regulator n=1 Tax=Serratia sp. 14-2641 TaxID=1841657 RepID=UPI0008101175|nr:AlpA family phage regulatory protein [Serratia sp. 14-2641]OCJ22624.1 transcriptional regulator [Serratia sp. 14-2641]
MKAAINRKRLLQVVPLSDSTIGRLEKQGKFPARFNLAGVVAWNLEEVETWLDLHQEQGTGMETNRKPDVRLRKARPVPL